MTTQKKIMIVIGLLSALGIVSAIVVPIIKGRGETMAGSSATSAPSDELTRDLKTGIQVVS